MALVSGEHDLGPERSGRLAERLLHGTHHLVADEGHYLQLEAPDALRTITAGVLAALQ